MAVRGTMDLMHMQGKPEHIRTPSPFGMHVSVLSKLALNLQTFLPPFLLKTRFPLSLWITDHIVTRYNFNL